MEIALKDRGTTCHVNLWTISPVVSSCVRIGCKGSTFAHSMHAQQGRKPVKTILSLKRHFLWIWGEKKSVWKCSGGAVYIQQNWSTNMHTMPNL